MKLKLTQLTITAGTQIRVAIHEATVDEYAEAMRAGVKFPPVVVFQDGEAYILADGFHRTLAAACEGIEEIEVELHQGSKADALRYALGANVAHGLRRSNEDKRRSVELALAEWPQLSDRTIAEVCAVAHSLVGDVRRHVESDSTHQPSVRTRKDGRQFTVKPLSVVQANTETAETESEAKESTGLAALFEQPLAELTPEQHQALWTRSDAGLKTEVAYHLELVRADANYLLEKLNESGLEAAELKDCETELRFAAKKVEALMRHLIFLSENQP